jgi:HAMP domain-containing protein
MARSRKNLNTYSQTGNRPVGLLIIQIAFVNYFIRELQSAVAFISSAHTVIETDFVAAELVAVMREDVKRLPSRYVDSPTDSVESDESLRPHWVTLNSHIDQIRSSDAILAIDEEIVNDVSRSLEKVSTEYGLAEEVMNSGQADLDTLLERAIFIDKALATLATSLSVLAVELRKQLQVAVDREREIHDRPAIAGIAIGGLAVLLLLAFTWLYVDRYFVARLTALGKSTLAIAGGDLKAAIPEADGNDEVSDMAESLKIFRDTAVEVEENNLREIATARQRLVDAIESISEGFSLYDQHEELVLCNKQYQELMYPGMENLIVPGVGFGTVIQRAADTGIVEDAKDRVAEWVDERMDRHRNPGGTFVQRRSILQFSAGHRMLRLRVNERN